MKLPLLWGNIPVIFSEKINVYVKIKGHQNKARWDFPGGAVVENLPANARDMGSIPGPGRSNMPWSN